MMLTREIARRYEGSTEDGGELTDQDLDAVVGGLARPWYGAWEGAEPDGTLALGAIPESAVDGPAVHEAALPVR